MMKKNRLIKTWGIYLTVIVLVTSLLTSCLKDNGPGSIDFSKSPALVSFQYYGSSAAVITTKLFGNAQDTTGVEITLSVSSITLKTPVTVQVVRDPAIENAYFATDTAADGTPNVHNSLPDADFTLANGGKVTINPGQQIVKLKINFAGDKYSLDDNYVLGLKLTNASGATIPSNLSEALLKLVLQSIYDATYSWKGFMVRGTGPGSFDTSLGGNFSGFSTHLETLGKYQVAFTPLWANGEGISGIDGLSIVVDPATNKVTMEDTENAALKNTPGSNNYYDPATKTFYLDFTWAAAPNGRQSIDTLTYTGP